MAAETGQYSTSVMSEEQKEYLRLLPLTVDRNIAGVRFHLCHATPSDPLFGYMEESEWSAAVISSRADVLVAGHTHQPLLRKLGRITHVNPGSLAGLRITSPQASYAIWEDGRLQLKRYSYPLEETIAAIESMPISQAVQKQLSKLITTGDLTVGGV
jgi:protein phosphatase